MRRRLIGLFFLFSAGFFLIANLINISIVLKSAASSYASASLFAMILTTPLSLVSSKIIIDDYNKHSWKINIINTFCGGVLGFIYSCILILLVTQSWVNTSNNASFAAEIPALIQFVMVIFGIIAGGILGWFASTMSFISLSITIALGAVLGQLLSDGVTPIVLSMTNSFILNLFIISAILGVYTLFGKKNKINKNDINKDKSSNLLDLLDLAKNKQKTLSKAEIMGELKLDVETVDNLLKEAEINQLCSVQLDEETGSIKYKFDV